MMVCGGITKDGFLESKAYSCGVFGLRVKAYLVL